MSKRIFVRSTLPVRRDGGSPVAFTEVHPDHPNGEAFVAGRKPVEVADTDAVRIAIREGKIEETEKPDERAAPAKSSQNPDALPDTTPGYEALTAAGITTKSEVARMSDEDLLQVKGIGEKTLQDLRKQIPATK